MILNFSCPHCGQSICAKRSQVGGHFECPTCAGVIMIPEATPVEEAMSKAKDRRRTAARQSAKK